MASRQYTDTHGTINPDDRIFGNEYVDDSGVVSLSALELERNEDHEHDDYEPPQDEDDGDDELSTESQPDEEDLLSDANADNDDSDDSDDQIIDALSDDSQFREPNEAAERDTQAENRDSPPVDRFGRRHTPHIHPLNKRYVPLPQEPEEPMIEYPSATAEEDPPWGPNVYAPVSIGVMSDWRPSTQMVWLIRRGELLGEKGPQAVPICSDILYPTNDLTDWHFERLIYFTSEENPSTDLCGPGGMRREIMTSIKFDRDGGLYTRPKVKDEDGSVRLSTHVRFASAGSGVMRLSSPCMTEALRFEFKNAEEVSDKARWCDVVAVEKGFVCIRERLGDRR